MTRFFSYAHSKIGNLVEAAYDCNPVNGLTHDFYRYPARFSPKFARAAIEAFTEQGDVVFDPFMGGGTTLVEASILGREGVGMVLVSGLHFSLEHYPVNKCNGFGVVALGSKLYP